jgi:hypothetical protein
MISWGVVSALMAFMHTAGSSTCSISARGRRGKSLSGHLRLVHPTLVCGARTGARDRRAADIAADGGVIGAPLAGWLIGVPLFGFAGWRALFC